MKYLDHENLKAIQHNKMQLTQDSLYVYITYFLFLLLLQELCNPNSYVRMLDDNHKEDLRHFKQRSKSWTGGDAATSKRRGRPRRSTIHSHTKTGPPPQKS